MKKRTTIYLDEDLHKKVRMLAIKENTTMAKIFVQALRRYLAEIEEDPRQEKFAQILGKAQ
jgi:predicted transcriptional regulator